MSQSDSPAPGGVRVLIAEDSPTQAARLKHTLERSGYLVTVTTDGRQALERARQSKPTLIISDIVMPEMDGYQLCRHVKSDPALRKTPVILVTTLSDPQDVIRGLECRADNFVIKPYDEHYLLSRIRFVLLNYELREQDQPGVGIEIHFNGQRHFITADRLQILNLLLSTYEAAIQRNQELTRIKDELRVANGSLEAANRDLEQAIASERRTHEALKGAQSQLVQAEKLAGLGQMVAGVAHEINNPLSFVLNNTWILQRDMAAIKEMMDLYRQQHELIQRHHPDAAAKLRELAARIDLDYTLNNVDDSLNTSRDGLKRIEQIVKDLRDFARLDRGELEEVNLNDGIQSTINIVGARARQKHVQIHPQLSPIPTIPCYPAKLNQVVMNLVSNAIDASPSGGSVFVRTSCTEREILIEVEDAGSGIDPAVQARIFDPFFTTKPPGAGTGLGLSISYSIICDHHGRIECQSAVGQGARFLVRLPIDALRVGS